VPALQHGNWACDESAVVLEYLEDIDSTVPLLPLDPRSRATCRLWINHINTRVVPAFLTLLRAQDSVTQGQQAAHLQAEMQSLVLAADEQGPFFLGHALTLVDIHLAPFALRLSRVMQPLRGWPEDALGPRWKRWLDALEADVNVKATTSRPELYAETAGLLIQDRVGAL
jgi:glutathione S-transferase